MARAVDGLMERFDVFPAPALLLELAAAEGATVAVRLVVAADEENDGRRRRDNDWSGMSARATNSLRARKDAAMVASVVPILQCDNNIWVWSRAGRRDSAKKQ
jgi:hypothetical protein